MANELVFCHGCNRPGLRADKRYESSGPVGWFGILKARAWWFACSEECFARVAERVGFGIPSQPLKEVVRYGRPRETAEICSGTNQQRAGSGT